MSTQNKSFKKDKEYDSFKIKSNITTLFSLVIIFLFLTPILNFTISEKTSFDDEKYLIEFHNDKLDHKAMYGATYQEKPEKIKDNRLKYKWMYINTPTAEGFVSYSKSSRCPFSYNPDLTDLGFSYDQALSYDQLLKVQTEDKGCTSYRNLNFYFIKLQ